MSADQYSALIEPVARFLLGEPNRGMSSKTELRYGSRGSLAIDLQKGTWYDHELEQGGGLLDLVARECKIEVREGPRWLNEHGFHLYDDDEPQPKTNGKDKPTGKITATYPYRDENGELLFEVVRFDPKDFRPRQPDGNGGWIWNLKGVRMVPYGLPELLEALSQGHTIIIVEGEKNADCCRRLGLITTCNAGGVGKWRVEFSQLFRDADVVVIPDNDPQKKHQKTGELLFHPDGRPIRPGQDHMHGIAQSLENIAQRVRYLDLAKHWRDMPPKADVFDWVARGGTREDLDALFDQAPDWSPELMREPVPLPIKFLCMEDFIGGFMAPDYLIAGMLQRRFVYALTGQTGHAKSAIALLIAELVSKHVSAFLGHHQVKKGHVIYFVGENPDDIRMRVIGANSTRDPDENPLTDRITFIPGTFNIGEMFSHISAHATEIGGVDLVIIDTSAAYFLGNEELNNTQMGNHARMLRRLTELPGGPCVLVLCHPIKYVHEPNQLLPRGGGAFLAEMDGNLTAWKHDDTLIELHHNKIRGPGFEPLTFKLEQIRTDALTDNEGRQLPTVRAVAISESEEDKTTDKSRHDEDQALAVILKKTDGESLSVAEIARRCGWLSGEGAAQKSRAHRVLDRLEKAKFIRRERGQHELTEKGKESARKAALRIAAQAAREEEQASQMDMGLQ